MNGKEPQRSCVGCRATRNKGDLLRFVLAPDRILVPDLQARLPGRGAYTCLNRSCLMNAAQKNLISRAFKGEVKFDGPERLIDHVIELMEKRIGSYLALANKAGKVTSGSDMVMDMIRKRKAGYVFVATDISPEIRVKIVDLSKRYEVPHVAIFEKDRLGVLIGKGLRSAAAIEKSGFINTIDKEIEKYRNFFEGGTDTR